MKYRGIFFDFDYTLGDSTPAILEGYRAGFAAMGWPPPTEEQVRPTVGMTLQDGYTLLTGDREEARRAAFYGHFQRTVGVLAGEEGRRMMVEQTRLFPGCEQLLRGLKEQGLRVAVVSTKMGAIIGDILARNGLSDCVELIVGGGDVSRHKPDPEGLLLACRTLGLTGGEVLFCGDTTIDGETARRGGTDFCAVCNGTTPAAAFASLPHVHLARDLNDLRRWLGL